MILYQNGGPTQQQKDTDPELVMWNRFNTKLTPEQEKQFQAQNKNSWDQGGYDIRGFWLNNEQVDERGHGGDRYKKPNHPTFSWGSENASYLYPGGEWVTTPPKKESSYYKPSWMTKAYFGPDQILQHLQDDPVQLIYGNDTIQNYYRK